MRWFRTYSADLHDARLQKLPATLFRHFYNLQCLANDNDPRGLLPNADEIAFTLRANGSKTAAILERLVAEKLIEVDPADGSMRPADWAERQYASDDVTARTREVRKRGRERSQPVRGNDSETLQERPQRQSQRTESESDTERASSPRAPAPEKPRKERTKKPRTKKQPPEEEPDPEARSLWETALATIMADPRSVDIPLASAIHLEGSVGLYINGNALVVGVKNAVVADSAAMLRHAVGRAVQEASEETIRDVHFTASRWAQEVAV